MKHNKPIIEKKERENYIHTMTQLHKKRQQEEKEEEEKKKKTQKKGFFTGIISSLRNKTQKRRLSPKKQSPSLKKQSPSLKIQSPSPNSPNKLLEEVKTDSPQSMSPSFEQEQEQDKKPKVIVSNSPPVEPFKPFDYFVKMDNNNNNNKEDDFGMKSEDIQEENIRQPEKPWYQPWGGKKRSTRRRRHRRQHR